MSAAISAALGTDAAYINRVLDVLWPDTSGRKSTMLVLPSRSDPRVLVRPGPARVAAGAVRALVSDRSTHSVARREAVSWGLRVGVGHLLRRRFGVAVGSGGIEEHLAGVLGQPVHVAVSIGSRRANRKPVLAVVRPDGCVLGFAKVGIDPLTRSLVRAEATALRRLSHSGLRSLSVARVLHSGHWNGAEILVQSALPTARTRPVRSDRLVAASTEIAAIERGPCELMRSPAWLRMSQALAAINGPHADGLRRHLRDVELRHGSTVLDVGAWHGDWTPWNVVATGDSVLAWDWERFALGVPVGYDALHHYVHTLNMQAGRPVEEVVQRLAHNAADVVAPYGVSADQAEAATSGYLLEIGIRYFGDGQDTAGMRLGKIENWVFPALSTLRTRSQTPGSRP